MVSEAMQNTLDNLFYPNDVKQYIYKDDLFNKSALVYMEMYDSYSLLETKILDRIMLQTWKGDVDTPGTLLNNSSCFTIIERWYKKLDQDWERNNRFYHWRDIKKV